MKQKKSDGKQSGKTRPQLHIMLLIFGAILIYLIVSFIMYFSGSKVTAYEVKTGSLSRNTVYNGLALRSENVVYAQNSGNVSYYQPESSKVKIGSNVCMTDLSENSTAAPAVASSAEPDYSALEQSIADFQEGFSPDHFEDTYWFHQQLESLMLDCQNLDVMAQLDELAAADPASYLLSKAPVDGIISYHLDGMENLTADTISEDQLSEGKIEETDLRKDTEKQSGDPIYKVITSENWSLILPLDDTVYEYLLARSPNEVQVQFHKDNSTLWGDLSLRDIGKQHTAVITFNQAMIRYASERYLDVTLMLQNETGLKIPQSAVVSKSFFLVPDDYLTKGGNSSGDGVLLETNNGNVEFHAADIYRSDEETHEVYLDSSVLSAGDTILKPDSSDTFTVGKTAKLKGVYNINKGYAVFKQIEILSENEEYCIISEGTDYGLSNYDFIALDGNSVKEDDIIH